MQPWELCRINAIIKDIKYIPKHSNIAENPRRKPTEQKKESEHRKGKKKKKSFIGGSERKQI